MRKAAIEGRKRYEIEQFVVLANLLRPRPEGEWPSPDDVNAMELEVSRGAPGDSLDALLDPLWKAARREFPPRGGDPWPPTVRGVIVVLRRPPALPYGFYRREAGELYRAAWNCRKTLIDIARASGAPGSYGTTLELPPAPRRFQILAGRLKNGVDFYRDFFLGALEDFDVTLIRLCDCGLIYLAKRRAQSGCSKRCANRNRQRQFRKDNPAYHRRHARIGRVLEKLRGAITVVTEISDLAEVA